MNSLRVPQYNRNKVRRKDEMSSENKGHGSELANVVTNAGAPTTNADGNLMDNIHGGVYTQNATGELKTNYANIADAINDALAKNHTHRIEADGVTVQQGAEPPTRYDSLANGRLEYKDGPRTSESVAQPTTTTAPATPGAVVPFLDGAGKAIGWPADGQVKGFTHGLYGGGMAPYEFTVATDAKNGDGQVSYGIATGSAGNPVELKVLKNGVHVLTRYPAYAGSDPTLAYRINGAKDENFVAATIGDTIRIELTPTGDRSNDMILDHRTPR